MANNIIWLVKMILAHLISDFLLQKDSWIADRIARKVKSKYLYWHIIITALTALLLVGFAYWKTILIISVTHYFIDLVKSYANPTFKNFILDQLSHLIIIFLSWALQFNLLPTEETLQNFYIADRLWIFAAGVFFLTYPSAILIDQATKHWSNQLISTTSTNNNSGLLNAGKYIGIIERLIICVLVYQSQYEAIGLLITGKSILRYQSANEEIKTEYLLVGTLISMSLAFAVGLLFKHLAILNIL